MSDYRIIENEMYTDKIGSLVSMLQHTRAVTIDEISNLTQKELDYLPDSSSNSIGSLLHHIVAIEFVHQVISFEERDLSESEYLSWKTSLELGHKARIEKKNKPHSYHICELAEVRENSLTQLKLKQDSWLFEEHKWENGVPYNNYYLWFHVMEDEINHRGQIRSIKRLLLNSQQR